MKIDIGLSIAELNQAIAKVNEYKASLSKKVMDLVDCMVKTGEEYALYYLSSHIYTGETITETYGYRNGSVGFIVSGGAAVWLEFGTGVVANGVAPGTIVHPMHLSSEEILISGIGMYGDRHGSDPDGWWYYDADGKKHHTYGIPATMYMWNTAQQLKRDYPEMARRLFET